MMKSGKMITVALVTVLGLGAALLSAQQQAPTFRTVTRLVEVTVTVLDKNGNAAAGLEPADFMLLDEGKPQPVELFRFDGERPAAPTVAAAPMLPSGEFTNILSTADNAPRNVTALMLDTINTPPEQSMTARAQMMRYLKTLAPQTMIAVFVMGTRLFTLHDFTDDAAALRARLEKVTLAVPAVTVTDYTRSIIEAEMFVDMMDGKFEALKRNELEVEAMANAATRRYRMEQSLAELEALGSHLAGIRGRKSLVWIGAGFSMASITGALGSGLRQVESFELKVQEASRRLAQQGIVLYIVDSRGIEPPRDFKAESPRALPLPGRGRFEAQMDAEKISNDTFPAMEMMTSITGGRFLFNTNDLTSGFKQVAADLQGSYTLGFYMPGNPDNKWHKLDVQVRRSGLNVRHREGYLADSRLTPAKWTEETWRTMISNPISSSAIPLKAVCKWTPSGELAVTVLTDTGRLQFQPDGENLKANLEILFGDHVADGLGSAHRTAVTITVPTAQWETARQQQARYDGIWKPAADATGLRVIVYDENSGQYGSLDVPLDKVPRKHPN
jgi:VWFA-related protein